MEIGIHGFELGDLPWYEELGVTWTKMGVDYSPPFRSHRPQLLAAREAGLNVVLDLRCGAEQIEALTQAALEAEGGNKVAAVARIEQQTAEYAAAYVEHHRDLCSNWEYWGECYCTWTADGVFNDYVAYTNLLKAVYPAIKAVQPEATVWTGGNGTNMDSSWTQALLQDDCGASFDVFNWHPFWISLRDLAVTSKLLEQHLALTRKRLREQARDQPFRATEWGMPHCPEQTHLWSNVEGGLMSLDYEEAVLWMNRDLAAFERWGFEVVIVHELHDHRKPGAQEMFWGNFCGLRDLDNLPKPTWDVIQEWAWKGQEGART